MTSSFRDRKLLLAGIMMFILPLSVSGQISITADSVIVDRWDIGKEANVTVSRTAEKMLLVFDKDLMTLRVTGAAEEKSYIEKGYVIDLLEVNDNMDKWLFQGVDIRCTPYTITLDLNSHLLSLINYGKSDGSEKPLITIYYPVTGITINKEAIKLHLKEKGGNNYKF